MKNKKQEILIMFSALVLISFLAGTFILAEISGDSPESNILSNTMKIYNSLVDLNHGDEDSGDLGTMLNRIKSSAEWTPDGTISDTDVAYGKTFYDGSRILKTSISGSGRYVAQKGTYNKLYNFLPTLFMTITQTGTLASVTDNGITKTISSNTVIYDQLTKLYWSSSSPALDNEFSYVNGDDRVNPTGASCNFNSAGTANQYCDNQDPTNVYTQDNDVSAAEFCLNLQLDSDNADGDSDGSTGVETDWRLPTEKEIQQAIIDGVSSMNNWSSTECSFGRQYASVGGICSASTSYRKDGSYYSARCVRRI